QVRGVKSERLGISIQCGGQGYGCGILSHFAAGAASKKAVFVSQWVALPNGQRASGLQTTPTGICRKPLYCVSSVRRSAWLSFAAREARRWPKAAIRLRPSSKSSRNRPPTPPKKAKKASTKSPKRHA